MKYRQGFVSNSSSTSFTVAFVQEKDNLNLKTFDFLLQNKSEGGWGINLDIFRDTVQNRRKTLNDELVTIERDKIWLQDHISKLTECADIPGIQLIMNELDQPLIGEDGVRYKRRKKHEPWDQVMLNHIHNYKNIIEEIDRKSKNIKEQLKLLENLSEDTVIAKWEEQNGGSSLLSRLLSMLKEDGRVVVLEEINT